MARATRSSHKETAAYLERLAHLLARVHDELRASAPSPRTARLLERNERERAKLAEKLGALRDSAPLSRPARVKSS
jgi:hypothetical protein